MKKCFVASFNINNETVETAFQGLRKIVTFESVSKLRAKLKRKECELKCADVCDQHRWHATALHAELLLRASLCTVFINSEKRSCSPSLLLRNSQHVAAMPSRYVPRTWITPALFKQPFG